MFRNKKKIACANVYDSSLHLGEDHVSEGVYSDGTYFQSSILSDPEDARLITHEKGLTQYMVVEDPSDDSDQSLAHRFTELNSQASSFSSPPKTHAKFKSTKGSKVGPKSTVADKLATKRSSSMA
ncbi:hypothetical protein O181_046456 [Austropuccinia psidii MF-1]|uniref:Uncharacterized protein n=1 Tax=Austropuccinia psidii MF-1 TaxID=1389203 RepID=A0A9Q3HIN0_9BASI|nr:hypothetical protein [Austropuccinia psidii MF-1]